MKDLLDPLDWGNVDWESLAREDEIQSDDLEGEQDHDDIDSDVAYQLGYEADAYSDCPFELGTEAAYRWQDGRDASELDAWQAGELPTHYRDPS